MSILKVANNKLIVNAGHQLSTACGGPTGACCIAGVCSIKSSSACIAAGGTYYGDGKSCSPNPCLSCPTCFSTPGTTQSPASVISTSPSGICDCAGIFSPGGQVFGVTCGYGWFLHKGSTTYILDIYYCPAHGKWWASINDSGVRDLYGNSNGIKCDTATIPIAVDEITSHIGCSSNKFSGAFLLTGSAGSCFDQSVSVTI